MKLNKSAPSYVPLSTAADVWKALQSEWTAGWAAWQAFLKTGAEIHTFHRYDTSADGRGLSSARMSAADFNIVKAWWSRGDHGYSFFTGPSSSSTMGYTVMLFKVNAPATFNRMGAIFNFHIQVV